MLGVTIIDLENDPEKHAFGLDPNGGRLSEQHAPIGRA
jgi:hypothetical protein